MNGVTRFVVLSAMAVSIVLAARAVSVAQVPGLPNLSPPASGKSKTSDKPQAAPSADNPKATVATTSGPISVQQPVKDRELRAKLQRWLAHYPGVRHVDVQVEDGVVTLRGRVDDDDSHDEITDLVRRVAGVVFVINDMKTDDEVMTAPQLAFRELETLATYVRRNWLLILMALAVVAIAVLLARLFARYSETVLAPFVPNVLLRSVVGSIISSILVIGGILIALSELRLTHVVLSILGLAGVVGLAVGFAFRDIAENFIASVLLGIRRPFQVGDYIQVAGYAGVVKSLNTRATVLVTLEGNHVRIPNSTIFKEIMVSSSASPTSRGSFDLLIPYVASTAEALTAVTDAVGKLEGVLHDPAPRALVDGLEPGGVRLRVYLWTPTRGIDGDKLMSDAKLRVKVALQHAGIMPPPTNVVTLSVAGTVPVALSRAGGQPEAAMPVRSGAVVTADQASANLHRDVQAAARANGTADGRTTPMEHVLKDVETRVSGEGANLLASGNGSHNHGKDE